MDEPELAPEPAAIVITPEPIALKLMAYAPTILVSSSLWNNWSRIAIEHEAEAWRYRTDWKGGRLRNIQPEFHSSLVCVAAVAFTFDALHGTLAPLLERDLRPDRKRWPYMRETIAIACRPSRGWQSEFAWLFSEARPKAVHFVPQQHEPIWHEGLQTSIAEENHFFSAESSTRAVDLMMDLFRALFTPGVRKHSAIKDWSSGAAHVLEELTALRTAVSAR